MANLTEQVNNLPDKTGVYLMKDKKGIILYIGKAASLRNRVRSYFTGSAKLPRKTTHLVSHISDIEFFITGSEQEALILELNLVRKYSPRYNIQLKDDKTFPYLKVNLKDEWPRFYVTRRLQENGGRYFGPFASAKSVRYTLRVIKEIFPFRSCKKDIDGRLPRPCLEYDIHRCLGPCTGIADKKEYDEVIRQTIRFLEGKRERIIKDIEKKMKQASSATDYERAAALRDQIWAMKRVIEGQRIAATVSGQQDAIALAYDKDQACVQVFFIRDGKLIGREIFSLKNTKEETPQQIMTSFVKQFYSYTPNIPPLVLLQYSIEEKDVISGWLSDKRGSEVEIRVPERGNKKKLIDIVAENARQSLKQLKIKHISQASVIKSALAEIQKELSLKGIPNRIEGYDISNIQGAMAVGSMVVFEGGKPKASHYRRFRIKTVPGADDFAMINEVIGRRFGHSKDKDALEKDSWTMMPDLVLIDGGKGQLNAALKAIRQAKRDEIPVIALAKGDEEIYLPGRSTPLILKQDSAGLRLLRHLRDEAHRFALGYHLKVRSHRAFGSALDSIPDIGPKRKRLLIRQFGSVSAIKEASVNELASVEGISRSLAEKIKEHL
jgi:excinuclease ABC subunit C